MGIIVYMLLMFFYGFALGRRYGESRYKKRHVCKKCELRHDEDAHWYEEDQDIKSIMRDGYCHRCACAIHYQP